jgi:hypothetical protein
MARVAGFKKLGEPKPEVHRYEVRSSDGGDITENIFHMVANNGWSLAELRKETASLEDVFRQLTTSDSQASARE